MLRSGSTTALLRRLVAGEDPPRTLIVVAHPDDETVGAAGQLARMRALVIAHLTDGAPREPAVARRHGFRSREAYAAARRRELEAAVALAGILPSQLVSLGAVDQEAALELVRLARAIAALVEELRPELLLTHPYEGGHPDHDAAAFVSSAALRLVERSTRDAPALAEMAFYHAAGGTLAVGELVPDDEQELVTASLDRRQRELKRRMLAHHATQREVLALFPVEVERFRAAPRYDFSHRPHEGPLLYERVGSPVTGSRLSELAVAALDELGLARG